MNIVMWFVFIYLAYNAIYKPDYSGIITASLYLALTLFLYPVFRQRQQ